MAADAEGIQNIGSQVRPLAGGGLSEPHDIAHRADGFGMHGRSAAARGKAEGSEPTSTSTMAAQARHGFRPDGHHGFRPDGRHRRMAVQLGACASSKTQPSPPGPDCRHGFRPDCCQHLAQ